MVKINTIELASLRNSSENFPLGLQQQLGSLSSRKSSPPSELYATIQLFGDQNTPMHVVPISTVNPARCNGSTVQWNEWVTLPVKFRDLPLGAKVGITFWYVGDVAIGSAVMQLFNPSGLLKDGLELLKIMPNTTARQQLCQISTTIDGDACEEEDAPTQLYRLEKLKEKYDRKQIPKNDWLDKLTFKRMAQIRQTLEVRTPEEDLGEFQSSEHGAVLWIELQYFGYPIVHEEEPYQSNAFRHMNQNVDDDDEDEQAEERKLNQQKEDSTNLPSLSSPMEQMVVTNPPPGPLLSKSSSSSSSNVLSAQTGHGNTTRGNRGTVSSTNIGRILTIAGPSQMVSIFDYEMDTDNPVEWKYRRLSRGVMRGGGNVQQNSIDPKLKPNKEERAALEHILSNPNDQLKSDEMDLVWKFRYTLTENSKAVTKFLLSVDWNDEQEVKQVDELLQRWSERAPIDIADALKLLGWQKEFKHNIVRQFAVETLSKARDEELLDYLLQLVQALRYDDASIGSSSTSASNNSDESTQQPPQRLSSRSSSTFVGPLAQFLIARAGKNFQLANSLYWYIKVELNDAKDGRMYTSVFNALLNHLKASTVASRRQIFDMLSAQDAMIQQISKLHQRARDERGRKDLKEEKFCKLLTEQLQWPAGLVLRMPLDPSILLTEIIPSSARMFKSALYPAVIDFHQLVEQPGSSSGKRNSQSSESLPMQRTSSGKFNRKSVSRFFGGGQHQPDEGARNSNGGAPVYKIMFKNGDDLRQDQLVMQMFILMDRLLKRVNLDLKLTPYRILATSTSDGLMEFVLDSCSVAHIVAEYETPQILNFLKQHRPCPTSDFGVAPEALSTYVKSVAGYCVLTYLLGIGDRHLDNLMMKTQGHLFHIDFGCIFGRDPKPYPPPFKLTKEMVEGMGGVSSEHYAKFKTYCCQAYNWLRRSASLILNLLSLMVDAGIEELSTDPATTLANVQEKFRLDLTDEQAEQFFLGLINDSVTSLFPVLMEYIHKVATKLR